MNVEPIAYLPDPSSVHGAPHVYVGDVTRVEVRPGHVVFPWRPMGWWWGLGPAWWPFGHLLGDGATVRRYMRKR